MNFLSKLSEFKKRKIAIIVDDLADQKPILCTPAKNVTSDIINEIISQTGGVIYAAITPTKTNDLLINRIKRENDRIHLTSIEAKHDVTTGISTQDRAITLSVIADDNANPKDIVTPGHIFPIEIRSGGVLVKNDLPEAAFDLVSLAKLGDVAAFIDLLTEDGEKADQDYIANLSDKNKYPLFTISKLLHYRLQNEKIIKRIAEAKLPCSYGKDFKSIMYRSDIHNSEHMVLVKGDIDNNDIIMTRIQTEKTFSDVFGSNIDNSREQIKDALNSINDADSGVFIYLRNADATILTDQITNIDKNKPCVEKEFSTRDYGIGVQILKDLGISKIKLITNSKLNLVGLENFGITLY